MSRGYTIGEAAKLLHVSRDTLRFYEKKKLAAPSKAENGYRYYAEEDIRMLLDLVFLRKLQCSIQDIQRLYADGSLACAESFLDLRIQEEEKEIRRHQQMLHQLTVTRYTRRKITEALGQYSLRQIPRTYAFSEKLPDYDLVRDAWFHTIQEETRLENCYLHEQLELCKEGQERQYYLVLEEYAVKELGLEALASTVPSFAFAQAVHCVYASKAVSPTFEDIQAMVCWAREQGIPLTGEVHAHYLWNHYREGRLETSYIEMYMPVGAGERALTL